MTDFIVISSGFVIPENSLYKKIVDEDSPLQEIFNRSQFINKDFLTDFFTKHKVYSSEVINNDLYNYINDKSSRNLFKLLDNTHAVFENILFKDFFKLQVENRYLSNICFNFLIDLAQELKNVNIDENVLNRYSYIPYNIRFNFNNDIDSNEKYKREKQLISIVSEIPIQTNIDFLMVLFKNKNAFLTFYKFVLADIY